MGFAIKESITRKLEQEPVSISDRLMTIILPLGKNTYVTIISAYAPTMTNPDDVKENFYSCLRTVIRKLPPGDKIVLIGDFYDRVGTDAKRWPGVIGYHDIGKCNSNGELLLALCSENEVTVTNSVFKHKDPHKAT